MFTLFKKTTPLALGILLCTSQACRANETCQNVKLNTDFKKGRCLGNNHPGSKQITCKSEEGIFPLSSLETYARVTKDSPSVHCGENARQNAEAWGKEKGNVKVKAYYYEYHDSL